MHVYVSNSEFGGGADGRDPRDGVSVFDFDTANGFRLVQTVGGLRSPSYMARHPHLPRLYVAERWINQDKSTPTAQQQRGDGVATFAIDRRDGTLSILDRRSTGGLGTMHLNVDAEGRYLLAANPGRPADPDPAEGHATAMRLAEDGVPARLTGSVVDGEAPPLWRDRPKPYPHSVFGDATWRRVLVSQLMTDRVMIYDFDRRSGRLSKPSGQPFVQVSSGAGPRHVAFHPNGRFFYVVNSFDATLSAFSYDDETGAAKIVQTASAHPAGFPGSRDVSHAEVSHDGRHLYCAHRTHNSIAVFEVDQGTGTIMLLQHQDTAGRRPFDFAFDPSGRTLVVANQRSSDIVALSVDPRSGTLGLTGHRATTHGPNCVVIGGT